MKACPLHGLVLQAKCTCVSEHQSGDPPILCANCDGLGWVEMVSGKSLGQYHHASFLTSILEAPDLDIRALISVVREVFDWAIARRKIDLSAAILDVWECSSPEEFSTNTKVHIGDVLRILQGEAVSASDFLESTTSLGTAFALLSTEGITFAGPLSHLRRKGKVVSDAMIEANRNRALLLAFGGADYDVVENHAAARRRLKEADPLVYKRCVRDKAWFDKNIPTFKTKPWFTPKRPATLESAIHTLKSEGYRSVEDLRCRRKQLYDWIARNHPAVLADPHLFLNAQPQ